MRNDRYVIKELVAKLEEEELDLVRSAIDYLKVTRRELVDFGNLSEFCAELITVVQGGRLKARLFGALAEVYVD